MKEDIVRLLKGLLKAMSSPEKLENWAEHNEEEIIHDFGIYFDSFVRGKPLADAIRKRAKES